MQLDAHIYYLLIERNLDHFTVTTLRNALQGCANEYKNQLKARLFAYEQIKRLTNKKLLVRSHNSKPSLIIYSKTSLFKSTNFIKSTKPISIENEHLNSDMKINEHHFEDQLIQIKSMYETELLMITSEIEEYKRLIESHPQKADEIIPFSEKGQIRLIIIKGKLAALSNILDTT